MFLKRQLKKLGFFLILCAFVFPLINTEAQANSYEGFSYSIANNEVTITDYLGEAKDVIIPEKIEGMPVTTIARYAFENKGLTSINFPGSITSIESYAFKGNHLTSIELPNNLMKIGSYAFAFNELKTVSLPDSIEVLHYHVFLFNQLTEIKLPKSLKFIYTGAFSFNNLIKVTIPDHVEIIGSQAFSNNKITTVSFPETVKSIGQAAFQNNKLTKVILPKDITKISPYSFQNNQLTSVTIPNNVTLIGSYAFDNNKLTKVTIPKKVKKVIDNAFNKNQLQIAYILNDEVLFGRDIFKLNPATFTIRAGMDSKFKNYALKNNYHFENIADYYPIVKVAQVTDSATTVTGTTDSNATVHLYKGKKLLSEVKAAKNGHYSFTVDKQRAGTVLNVHVNNRDALTTVTSMTVIDKTAPTLKVNNVSDYSIGYTIRVSGTTEAGAKLTVKSGKQVLETGKPNDRGYFVLNVPRQKAGVKLTITSVDKAGNSKSVSKVVLDKTPPFFFVGDEIIKKATSVTGYVDAGATVYVYKGKTKLGSAKGTSIGRFKVKIKKQKVKAKLTVYAVDQAKNSTEKIIMTVVR